MKCSKCKQTAHTSCYSIFSSEPFGVTDWLCILCVGETLPFLHINDDEEFKKALYEFHNDIAIDFNFLNSLIFNPFEHNTDRSLLCNLDPDIHYFSQTQYAGVGKCDYYTVESLKHYLSNNLNSQGI